MNVVLPTNNKLSKTRKIIYISIGIICAIAAFVIIYVQYIKDSKIALAIGKNDMSEDEYQELKVDFDNVFNNSTDERLTLSLFGYFFCRVTISLDILSFVSSTSFVSSIFSMYFSSK